MNFVKFQFQFLLKRFAQPLNRLQRHFKEFQTRQLELIKTKNNEAVNSPPNDENASRPRSALGQLPTTKKVSAIRRSQPKPTPLTSQPKPQVSRNNPQKDSFEIFEDEEPTGSSESSHSPVFSWSSSLPGVEERHKENESLPSKWANQKV
jgi:hypothetical protein